MQELLYRFAVFIVFLMALKEKKMFKSGGSVRPPRKFVPIGEYFVYSGMRLQCMPRYYSGPHSPSECCKGCALRDCYCDHYQCSASDREDHVSVWFVLA